MGGQGGRNGAGATAGAFERRMGWISNRPLVLYAKSFGVYTVRTLLLANWAGPTEHAED